MKISLRRALELAVGPANVDAAGHAVADWFNSIDWYATANRVREALQDQPGQPADAVPHSRPDTSLRSELLQKLATQREVILSLCDRVDRLEMRADGLTPIERVQRRWAKKSTGGDKLDRQADGPAVPDDREPASVAGEPTDRDLRQLYADTFDLRSDPASLGPAIVKFARAVLARWGHQPAPPAEGEVAELVVSLRRASDGASAMGWEQDARTIARAAELLQQRHLEPVPVSKRLPGPEDCTTNPRNGQGQWCWGWVQHDQPPYSGRWRMMLREWLSDEARAWLPAHALPLPGGELQP